MADANLTAQVEYRDIPECEGYTFGSDGSVMSFWGSGRNSPGEICFPLKQRKHKSGHLNVRVKIDGKTVMLGVHVLICRAFHGPCPENHEACHKDGIPDHNWPDNLYWGTRQKNIDDQFIHGVFARGERHGMATFTEDDIRTIRRLAKDHSCGHIARIFDRSRNTIKAIVCKQTWKHVV